ncbi:phospholipase D-like domain-containing anti-phage protein [Endozoicomonas sp. ALC020]|uniref:phospholipase D-like domain-containing anti-phage protein n=1 Tax=unclassified Endozoicomonas TaxID=2644528 RepID=UPI003BB1911A
MSIRRFSSRTHQLDKTFLADHLKGARSYKRIAGYFTSSLFEVAHEWIEDIPDVKIVCNVDIHPDDLKVAQLRESKMIGRWNKNDIEAESLLNRSRYKRLDEFLAKRGQVIRVAPDSVCGFVHGKAGVIELADGRKLGFIGSMNETSSGWQRHYEILWEDSSPEGVAWIEEEFDYLWNAARPLPEAVCREIKRRGRRHEIIVDEISSDDNLAPAALVESPMYREGMSLQPWQQGFITECLSHYRNYGVVRLLLADEVGLGKTLSMGTAMLALCLLAEKEKKRRKPVIIFAPATLCEQWQTEMMDKLGVPCARWNTEKKVWWDHDDRAVSPSGTEHIAKCPLRIGIVSTGLMMRDSLEKQYLLGLNYGLVILDEAHKARSRQGFGKDAGSPNALLDFIREVAARSDHVLLGTATPIQTRPEDLWDLVRVLHQGKGRFVLGNDFAPWHSPKDVLPIFSGEEEVTDPQYAWELLRSPLPTLNSTNEGRARRLYSAIRQDLGIPKDKWQGGSYTDLSIDVREDLQFALESTIAGASFFQRENPFVRHVVLRKRTTLEDAGLLKKIGVDIHPNLNLVRKVNDFHALFEGQALRTSEHFREAYAEARVFGKALSKDGKGGGFMKNLMEQRICSSVIAGINTAQKLLEGRTIHEETDDEDFDLVVQNDAERSALTTLLHRLKQVKEDPKLNAVIHYLETEGWLEHGVIIFSQYYDTAHWVADSLAKRYKQEAVGLYAGAGRSKLYREGEAVGIQRETLKEMVADRELRIMVATDAACEGLNLQTLGTLINIDLPWNPTKLEQRIGRIKRFGQARDRVDMLNLVNEQTVDEKVYDRLSERMRDRFDLFGSLPDTIKDEWIEDIETLGEKMDEYIHDHREATGFDLRYNASMQPSDNEWRDCSQVLSQRDFASLMREGWSS